MPSSYTSRSRLTLQAPGENNNTWGTLLNNGAIQLLEDSKDGSTALTVNGPITLVSANGATDQARMAALICTGSGGLITAPGVQKIYVIDAAAATGNISIGTGAGAVAVIPIGLRAQVICPDSVNFYLVQDPTARTYTDNKVLLANAGNLPGGSIPRGVVYTDPVTGIAEWHVVTSADVSDFSAQVNTLTTPLARDITNLELFRASSGLAPTAAGFADDFVDLSGVNAGASSGYLFASNDVSNMGAVTVYDPPGPPATINGVAPTTVIDLINGVYKFNGTTYGSLAALVTAVGGTNTGTLSASGYATTGTQVLSLPGLVLPNSTSPYVVVSSTDFANNGSGTGSSAYGYHIDGGSYPMGVHTYEYGDTPPTYLIYLPTNFQVQNYLFPARANVAYLANNGSNSGSLNGGAIASDTNTTPSSTGYTLYVGNSSGGTYPLGASGYARWVAIYPTTATAAQLQSASTVGKTQGLETIPNQTSNTAVSTGAAGYTAFASVGGATAWQAFDNNPTGTPWAPGATSGFVGRILPAALGISAYKINASGAPTAWTFQGSNDTTTGSDGTWTTLSTLTGVGASVGNLVVPLAATATYKAYRLNVTAGSGNISVNSLQLLTPNNIPALSAMTLASISASLKYTPSRIYCYVAAKSSGGVINTDIAVGVSRNGSTFTNGTLVDIQDLSSGYSIYELRGADGSPGVDVTGQTSGSTVGYKITTTVTYRQDFSGAVVRAQ